MIIRAERSTECDEIQKPPGTHPPEQNEYMRQFTPDFLFLFSTVYKYACSPYDSLNRGREDISPCLSERSSVSRVHPVFL